MLGYPSGFHTREELLEVVGEQTAAHTFPGSVTLNGCGGHSWWLQINADHLTSIIYALFAPPPGPEAARNVVQDKTQTVSVTQSTMKPDRAAHVSTHSRSVRGSKAPVGGGMWQESAPSSHQRRC